MQGDVYIARDYYIVHNCKFRHRSAWKREKILSFTQEGYVVPCTLKDLSCYKDDLDWGQHTSEISSKATKTLGFLRRNLAFAPRHTKEVAYKTLVRPKLEYAAPIWHPYHETQIGQVEKVQRTAARWICRRWRNTSSVGDMLDDLEWPSLETRREQSSLTFFYKIHSGTVDLDKDKYLTPAPNLRRTRASHESQYTRYFAYSDALKKFFFPRTIPMFLFCFDCGLTSR